MKIHKNARTTPRSRGQIMARVLTGWDRPAAAAAAVSVRERTVRIRLTGYTGEATGLADRSCRPRRRPTATPAARLRGQRWAGAQIAQALHLSASMVTPTLQRQGPALPRVKSDNGSGYVADRFARLCRRAGLRYQRNCPYAPRTNGKAERFIQTDPLLGGPDQSHCR